MQTKKIGIFLGRMQPFHEGHQWLIKKIFDENQEVIICIGSAQQIGPDDPKNPNNPLSFEVRRKRVVRYLNEQKLTKPYKILPIADIDSDRDWPQYLAQSMQLDKNQQNVVYFGDSISESYRSGMGQAGFKVKVVERKKFKHQAPNQEIYVVGCASDIRNIYKEKGIFNKI